MSVSFPLPYSAPPNLLLRPSPLKPPLPLLDGRDLFESGRVGAGIAEDCKSSRPDFEAVEGREGRTYTCDVPSRVLSQGVLVDDAICNAVRVGSESSLDSGGLVKHMSSSSISRFEWRPGWNGLTEPLQKVPRFHSLVSQARWCQIRSRACKVADLRFEVSTRETPVAPLACGCLASEDRGERDRKGGDDCGGRDLGTASDSRSTSSVAPLELRVLRTNSPAVAHRRHTGALTQTAR